MAARSVRIIKFGTLTIEAFEEPDLKAVALKELCGVGGGSNVIYIESDARIIVDTGFDFESSLSEKNAERNRKNLLHHLAILGLEPADIDIIFITHWHMDHFGNLGVFGESEIVTAKAAVEKYGFDFTGVRDGDRIADGVRAVSTPGHTADHMSLVVETERLRYSNSGGSGGRIIGIGEVRIAVAGDAVVSPSYYLAGKVWKYNPDFHSEEEAVKSVERLKNMADYIIPGHGCMFRV